MLSFIFSNFNHRTIVIFYFHYFQATQHTAQCVPCFSPFWPLLLLSKLRYIIGSKSKGHCVSQGRQEWLGAGGPWPLIFCGYRIMNRSRNEQPMKKTFLLSTFMQLPTYHMQSRAALHTRRFNSNFAIFPNSTALAKRQDQTNSGLNKKAKRTLKIALGLCFFMILSVNVLIVKQQICFSSLNLQQVIIILWLQSLV